MINLITKNKMKNLLALLVLVLISGASFSQKKEKDTAKVHLNLKDNRVFYVKVIDSLPYKKHRLFNASLKWMAERFNDPKEVIQLKDKEAGIITGSGNFQYAITGSIGQSGGGYLIDIKTVSFIIDIAVKDYKSRIRLYQFEDQYTPSNSDDLHKTPIEEDYFRYLSENRFSTEDTKYYQAIDDHINSISKFYKSYLKKKSGKDDF